MDTPSADGLGPALAALRRQGIAVAGTEPMAGDVSRRRYRRVHMEDGSTAVLALYPPDLLDACHRFLVTGALLDGAGVRVPRVLAHGCAEGWSLVEDLGGRTLYDLKDRPWAEVEPCFEDAVEAAGRIAGLPPAEVAPLNPPLDAALLARELRQTREQLFEPLGMLGAGADGDIGAELDAALEVLCRRLGADRQVPCHRDFGARNLVPLPPGAARRVGVLDHQDLRLGPPAYDLASLLNDSLFPPPEGEAHLLDLAGQTDREAYHRVAAQRTLKAAGSYAAFARRGSPRHLPLIPPTLERALGHLGRIPEAGFLAQRLRALWRPVLAGSSLEALLPSGGGIP